MPKLDHKLLKDFLSDDYVIAAPRLADNDPITKILHSSCSGKLVSEKKDRKNKYYWDETRYNLYKSTLFKSQDKKTREKILNDLSRHTLAVSYFIEKTAISFALKMGLLSTSLEERALYGMIVSEEVMHQQEFLNFIDFHPEDLQLSSPLVRSLGSIVQNADKASSLFIGQIFLEGFGIAHYNVSMDNCNDEDLKRVFSRILQDEARHHGSAVVLFGREDDENINTEEIYQTSSKLLEGMKNYHQVLFKIFEKNIGPLSLSQKMDLLNEIEYSSFMCDKTDKIRDIIKKSDKFGIVSRLERDGIFEASMPVL